MMLQLLCCRGPEMMVGPNDIVLEFSDPKNYKFTMPMLVQHRRPILFNSCFVLPFNRGGSSIKAEYHSHLYPTKMAAIDLPSSRKTSLNISSMEDMVMLSELFLERRKN